MADTDKLYDPYILYIIVANMSHTYDIGELQEIYKTAESMLKLIYDRRHEMLCEGVQDGR